MFLCNIIYSEIPGIRMWYFGMGALFCLPQHIFLILGDFNTIDIAFCLNSWTLWSDQGFPLLLSFLEKKVVGKFYDDLEHFLEMK